MTMSIALIGLLPVGAQGPKGADGKHDRSRTVSASPPQIELLPARTERGDGTIKIAVRLVDVGGGIGPKVTWRFNGKALDVTIALGSDKPNSVGGYAVIEQTLPVNPRVINEIEIVAYSGKGSASSPYRFMIYPPAATRQGVLLFHGSTSGEETFDARDGGGNPFAGAFIEVLAKRSIMLAELPAAMRELTATKSGGFQKPDVPTEVIPRDWSLVPQAPKERRIALVLIVSDYSKMGPDSSLSGAKYDANRIAAALVKAGFLTEIALDLDLRGMKHKLSSFATKSKQYDAAVIYTTGHGVEFGGEVFLLPGDYPLAARTSALAKRALQLVEIANSVRARHVNLVFYGGCRNNPWPDQ